MKAEVLRKSILQMAIQGKLVPQNSSDEPASVLLQKIRAEKEKLMNEGKIKKEKSLPPITDCEIPFAIPDTWRWVRLGELATKFTDGTHSTPKYVLSGVPFLSVKDMSRGVLDFSNTKFISEEEHKILYKRCNPEKGDLLITKVGTTGVPVIVDTDKQFSLFVSVALMKFSPQYLDVFFLKELINSPLVQQQAQENTRGVGNKNWVLDDIRNTIVPLPPLEEQKRIVEAIEKFEPLLSEYDKLEQQAEKLDGEIFDKLKKSILQYAIQGKLVPQDSSDEPASVLLSKIKAEKEKLIKEGKIKKEKPLPPITDSEKPFDIPDTWQWVRLAELGETQTGTTPSTDNIICFGNDIPFIKPADIYTDHIDYGNEGLSFEGSKHSRVIDSNSIMMVCIGGSIGKFFINDRKVCCNQQINTITPFIVDIKYLWGVLGTDYFQKVLKVNSTGTATPIINKYSWGKLLVPLPPLNEQKRIVARIESIFAEIDSMIR